MATIEDLNYESIVNEDVDKSIERLRQIRLSRRTPIKKVKTSKKATSKTVSKAVVKSLDKNSINELLEMIGDD
jgi:hypothetical protein